MTRVRHFGYLAVERLLTWALVPQLRAQILRALGATIGRNVRIYEARFFNLSDGFRNLVVGDDVHIGPGTLVDLTDRVSIGSGSVISPRCILLTHTDAGEQHGSPMTEHIRSRARAVADRTQLLPRRVIHGPRRRHAR